MNNDEYKNSYIFIGILIGILLLLFAQIGSLNSLYDSFSLFSKPLNEASYNYFGSLRENLDFLKNLRNFKGERDKLTIENQQLTSQITNLTKELEITHIFQKQLQFDQNFDLEPVRVIKYDETIFGVIYINKGSKQGLKVGEVLIKDNYAIGEIISITKNTSQVLLINTSQSNLPVITLGAKTKGVVQGDIQTGLILKNVLIDAKLKKTDMVITSGINSNYPHGLVVGSVDDINFLPSEVTKTAKLKNPIDFNNLLELFVIKN